PTGSSRARGQGGCSSTFPRAADRRHEGSAMTGLRFVACPRASRRRETLPQRHLAQSIVERDERAAGWASRPLEGGGQLQRIRSPERVDSQESHGLLADGVAGPDLEPAATELIQQRSRFALLFAAKLTVTVQ